MFLFNGTLAEMTLEFLWLNSSPTYLCSVSTQCVFTDSS
jgi:hypothetical protein